MGSARTGTTSRPVVGRDVWGRRPLRPEDERRLLMTLGWARLLLVPLGLVSVILVPDQGGQKLASAAILFLGWLPASLAQLVLARRRRSLGVRVSSMLLDVSVVTVDMFVVRDDGFVVVPLAFLFLVALYSLLDTYLGGLLVTGLATAAALVALMTRHLPQLRASDVFALFALGVATTALVGYGSRTQQRAAAQSAESLAHARDQLLFSLEAAEMGLWEWDITRNHVEWDEGTLRIFRRSAAPPDVASFLEVVHPDDRDMLQERVESALAGNGFYHVQHRLAVDGRTRWIMGKGRVVTDAAGRPARLVGVVTDITEQREQQAELERVQRMETVSNLAGGVAHDFNNLLTVILMAAESLRLTRLEAEQADHVRLIADSARRGGSLSRQLLTFARRVSGHPRPIRLAPLVLEVEPMLRRALRADIALDIVVPPSLPAVLVDPTLLEQALLNLAVNARDAIPSAGQVRLSARVVTEGNDARPAYVAVEVADSGTGMSEEVREHALDPFFTTKGPDRGTGLGLATVYSTVTAVGGRVEIDSQPGRGTTIRLLLPLATEADSPEAPDEQPHRTHAGARILVVDDDARVRQSVALALRDEGYEVVSAEDGREGLRRFDSLPDAMIDLVVTDLVLPGLSGPELVDELRRRGVDPPVLYMSGYTDASLQAGVPAAPMLQKPFTRARLVAAVEGVLTPPRASTPR